MQITESFSHDRKFKVLGIFRHDLLVEPAFASLDSFQSHFIRGCADMAFHRSIAKSLQELLSPLPADIGGIKTTFRPDASACSISAKAHQIPDTYFLFGFAEQSFTDRVRRNDDGPLAFA